MKVNFIGHIVSEKDIEKDSEKTEKVFNSTGRNPEHQMFANSWGSSDIIDALFPTLAEYVGH